MLVIWSLLFPTSTPSCFSYIHRWQNSPCTENKHKPSKQNLSAISEVHTCAGHPHRRWISCTNWRHSAVCVVLWMEGGWEESKLLRWVLLRELEVINSETITSGVSLASLGWAQFSCLNIALPNLDLPLHWVSLTLPAIFPKELKNSQSCWKTKLSLHSLTRLDISLLLKSFFTGGSSKQLSLVL